MPLFYFKLVQIILKFVIICIQTGDKGVDTDMDHNHNHKANS